MKFAKVLTTPIFKNIYERVLLRKVPRNEKILDKLINY